MESTEAALENPSSIITILGWGFITVDQLESPFNDDENDAVNPVFPCTLCGKTFALPSSLKNHERLRHGNKRQRRDSTPQVSAYGDKNLTYTFSGNTLPTKPLIPSLTKILNETNKFLKEGLFNYILINLYKDGYDKIGSHKNNEKYMDLDSVIVTFSFGAERTMIFKRPNFDLVKFPLKLGVFWL
ncbi:hypothetical protein AVEN_14159-1 [Araneus ventricosus]|uniref:C2H2-type domain-containing protein n=1 Tax=Araneus ventricosus TaxID=182803 RepID=A0A4Y2P1G3_ARAVE|nr:hypothetical protein AVEN_14159-1 [Araneus ventricosus]